MAIHHINLHPQLSEWTTGGTSVGANGTITATLMEAGMPKWYLNNQYVRSPNTLTQNIVAGGLDVDHQFDLHATSGLEYWKFTITLGTIYRTFYFTWDDVAHTDFQDLDFINPRTYAGA